MKSALFSFSIISLLMIVSLLFINLSKNFHFQKELDHLYHQSLMSSMHKDFEKSDDLYRYLKKDLEDYYPKEKFILNLIYYQRYPKILRVRLYHPKKNIVIERTLIEELVE